MKEPGENHSNPCVDGQRFSGRRRSSRTRAASFARIVEPAGKALRLAAIAKRGRPPGIKLRCECSHAKSIHSRMYANPKLGTSCNYPGCRCKAYKPGSGTGKRRARR